MSKPAGAIEAADGGLQLPGSTDNGYPVRIPTGAPFRASHWSANSMGLPLVQASRQLSVNAGDTVTDRVYCAGAIEETVAGLKSGSWEDYDEDGGTVLAAQPLTTLPDSSDPEAPAWCRVGTNIDDSLGSRNAELLALHFEFTNNDTYDGPLPEITRSAETAGRNTDANSWRPYDAQRPCSAWLMRRVLCNTVNRLAFESRQAWTVPV